MVSMRKPRCGVLVDRSSLRLPLISSVLCLFSGTFTWCSPSVTNGRDLLLNGHGHFYHVAWTKRWGGWTGIASDFRSPPHRIDPRGHRYTMKIDLGVVLFLR
ncbi:hypothetical protein B0H14DRAFT_128198 [Mycena olivaceomarginata]|nr:hypothetical protein B0H14DRAFT_128198 [Mycena olivaceomarginata]